MRMRKHCVFQKSASTASVGVNIKLCRVLPVAEWLECWTQAQKGPGSNRSRDVVGQQSWANCSHPSCLCSPSSEIGSCAGLAESNDSLPPCLWLTSPAGWLPRTGISSGTLRSVIEYGQPILFYLLLPAVDRDSVVRLSNICSFWSELCVRLRDVALQVYDLNTTLFLVNVPLSVRIKN